MRERGLVGGEIRYIVLVSLGSWNLIDSIEQTFPTPARQHR